MFPPCLCISAMRSEVKYVADRVKLLSDGSRKLRLVYNDFARHILFVKGIRLGAILAPTLGLDSFPPVAIYVWRFARSTGSLPIRRIKMNLLNFLILALAYL